jgi:decaprenylphospho-beta-D-erythro-pentofuranosid-2-ulose 2-reductase
MKKPETWLILGGSSAVGRAIAFAAAERGHDVLIAGRDLDDLERSAADIRISTGRRAIVLPFDATMVDSHAAFAADAARRTDVLNVALVFGVMPPQEEMDRDPGKAAQCIEGCFTGAVSILHHLAPHLEAKGSGIVIALGSVAGDRGRLKNYIYGGAKAGLHVYLAGLRNRLARKGVHVMTVKPGFVDSAMTWGMPGLFLVAGPQDVARACLRAAQKRTDILYVPWFWRWIMAIICAIPERIFKRLSF